MSDFSKRLLAWYARHGRRDLPWQRDPTPWRVWVSEIMLQQTQVSVVRGYFDRFMARFPDVRALADAPPDDILGEWAGLGYYSRARNLHRAAISVRDRHAGTIPRSFESLLGLPGIGPSTAGAILALAHGDRHPILDGNVKRVLCRYHGIAGWPGQSAIARTLWDLAERHTPHRRVAAYTQAIMDLGATLCVRSHPKCTKCPLTEDCIARRRGLVSDLPTPRPKRTLPLRRTVFLVLRSSQGAFLLERRPPIGIWGGLWCFLECKIDDDPASICQERLGLRLKSKRALAKRVSTFTHFRLEITPIVMEVASDSIDRVADSNERRWYAKASAEDIGLPAPIRRLIDEVMG
ncbi:A/G-specific adenine glycosylase [Thioalkalivibrio sp. HK1]|uniref:A/G-specific adenine glycosylase n=1 Tax=Thioalkalivibrio sp. HK1 TaxID=1469245 RepID=UPI0004B7248A|nr:A/G-specific adenine glycosylase [Thioalkalivibrio sp. HK1]